MINRQMTPFFLFTLFSSVRYISLFQVAGLLKYVTCFQIIDLLFTLTDGEVRGPKIGHFCGRHKCIT